MEQLDTKAEPLVSVVIATRDRPLVLAECLRCVYAQGYSRFEVIVVDNSLGQAATFAVVQDFTSVHYLRHDPNIRNPAQTRNLGISQSRGQMLAFIDDDTLVAPGWMQSFVRTLSDTRVGGVTGRVNEADAPVIDTSEVGRFTPTGKIAMNFNNTIQHPLDVDFLYGCNMAVSRAALARVGVYDPWFGITYEEQDLSFRIWESGLRLLFVPGMEVRHLKAPRPTAGVQRSEGFDVRSLFVSCRSLAYLCVSHFGVRKDFAKVAFFNLPKGAARAFMDSPSLHQFWKIWAILVGGSVGYLMAAARRLGLHRPPPLQAIPSEPTP